jgi:hypothetical protein
LPTQLIHSFNTAETKWLEAPVFILDEDLLGLCSHSHSRHFDLIYPDCVPSVASAETAVYVAIERWQQATAGTAPGVRDTLSRDVPQRLHLVATSYINQLDGQKQGVAAETVSDVGERAHGTGTSPVERR